MNQHFEGYKEFLFFGDWSFLGLLDFFKFCVKNWFWYFHHWSQNVTSAHCAISWGLMIIISKNAKKIRPFQGRLLESFKSQTHTLDHFSSWRLPWLSYIPILIYPGGLKNAFRNISRPHLAGQLTLRPLSGNFYRKWFCALFTWIFFGQFRSAHIEPFPGVIWS